MLRRHGDLHIVLSCSSVTTIVMPLSFGFFGKRGRQRLGRVYLPYDLRGSCI